MGLTATATTCPTAAAPTPITDYVYDDLGRTFASRMAGGLLTSLGVPELLATDLSADEEKAVALGKDPARQRELRRRVEEARQTSPLFDMPGFVRDFGDAIAGVAMRR